ncbi:neuronal acetylcholine receptor subunit alpha-2-like [Dreissena polymorpha]|uniref:neuronal acetylcholine receptor subunit alpha-2-like n=1 Tax=Dreissena polymorpha TaxID=45954 RepID=UPI002264BA06|nr:neuronal acetylcholine receptor subunit alpha-2-like [Dreissena polymorpha]
MAPGYDAFSRPNDTTEVMIGVSVLNIEEWDRRKQIYSFTAWITAEWMDVRLTWDPATNDGIESVFSTPDLIWKPDIAVDNIAEDLNAVIEAASFPRYDYTGRVVWRSKGYFRVYCKIGDDYLKNEEQYCLLEVTGWRYNISEVLFMFQENATNTKYFSTHTEWSITDTKTVTAELGDSVSNRTEFIFPKLEFWFKIERKGFEGNVLIFALFLTAWLILMTFLVPVKSGERLSYIVALYLSMIVILSSISENIPSDFVRASGLYTYLTLLIVLSGQAIVCTVFVLHVHHNGFSSFVRTACGLCCIRKLLRNETHPRDDRSIELEVRGSLEPTSSGRWKKNLQVLEAVSVFVYLIQIVIYTITTSLRLRGVLSAEEFESEW